MARALAPVVGTLLLVAVTVAIAATLGATALLVTPGSGPTAPAVVSATATTATGQITLIHEAGPAIDVRGLALTVTVDGTPLDHQPPIPFFSAAGFASGPTGPFNVAADPTWTAGEAAGVRLASTNAPAMTPGATVVVRIERAGRLVAAVETTAQ